jgi:hypothetical protein
MERKKFEPQMHTDSKMTADKNKWEQWEAATGFRGRVQKLAEKHRADRAMSPGDYLVQKRIELAHDIENKKLIYLDTKHWVNLCRVVQNSQDSPIYSEILGLLELLRQKSRICCPVSSSLFMELMKQNDIVTRRSTARIMDYLSGGVCIRYWLEQIQFEFVAHVHRTFNRELLDESIIPTWTKAGYWAGEHTIEFPKISIEESDLMEKVYIDLRWDMTFEDYQSMPDTTLPLDKFADAWAEAANTSRGNQLTPKPVFSKLVKRSRNQLLSLLKDHLLPTLVALRGGSAFGFENDLRAVLDPIYEGRDPNALPSMEILAGLDTAIAFELTRIVQAKDMLDFLHAAQALPYCDALFCDNFMAQKMKNRPLEFGKIYETEIGSRPEEIVAYLNALN